MGRAFRDVAVIKAYDAQGAFVCEDIVPSENFATSGSLLLNVAAVRAERGIRFISFREFNRSGVRTESQSFSYDANGQEVRASYRRPDGTIIENVDWV
jgi:hypothetical protein